MAVYMEVHMRYARFAENSYSSAFQRDLMWNASAQLRVVAQIGGPLPISPLPWVSMGLLLLALAGCILLLLTKAVCWLILRQLPPTREGVASIPGPFVFGLFLVDLVGLLILPFSLH